MKWKSKYTERIVEVLGDEKVNNRNYRFFYWLDDPKQTICQFDLLYAIPSWDEQFEPLDNSVKP